MEWRFAAILLAMLVAFCWHNFVIQTHAHLPAAQCETRNAGSLCQLLSPDDDQHPRTPDRPDDCPLCHELAMSGHYIAPPAIGFVPPVMLLFWLLFACRQQAALQRRSHRWQSRAPPHPLQA